MSMFIPHVNVCLCAAHTSHKMSKLALLQEWKQYLTLNAAEEIDEEEEVVERRFSAKGANSDGEASLPSPESHAIRC